MKCSEKQPNLDELIKEITVDAHGDHEMLWAFRQALEDVMRFPCDAEVIGERVSLLEICYDGNERRGLTFLCCRKDGLKYSVSAADVTLPQDSAGYMHLACYRTWLGIDPFPKPQKPVSQSSTRQGKKEKIPVQASSPVELAVLSTKQLSARCRLLNDGSEVTFRSGHSIELIPGRIVAINPSRQWSYAGHPYISGEIISSRLDIPALGLTPLAINHFGPWDPASHYWGEPDEPIEPWAKPIIARGIRQSYEMEQVMPGVDPDDFETDPVYEAVDLHHSGNDDDATAILMGLCQQDLRCLDAHAHLGNFSFDTNPKKSALHYETGFRIGELSLGADFYGLLPWGLIDNRPFLRCMHGYGLALWRLGRFKEAEVIFERMLWLNPSDNQGVRFKIDDVKAEKPWTAD